MDGLYFRKILIIKVLYWHFYKKNVKIRLELRSYWPQVRRHNKNFLSLSRWRVQTTQGLFEWYYRSNFCLIYQQQNNSKTTKRRLKIINFPNCFSSLARISTRNYSNYMGLAKFNEKRRWKIVKNRKNCKISKLYR